MVMRRRMKMSNNLIEILRVEVRGKKNATEALKELENKMELLDAIERCFDSANTGFDSFAGNTLNITICASTSHQPPIPPNPDYSRLLSWSYERIYKRRGMTPPTSKENKYPTSKDADSISLTRAQKKKIKERKKNVND